MAELTIPFWLTSSVLADSQSINDWLKSERVQPRWIDEVIRITDNGAEDSLIVSGIGVGVPQINWASRLYSEHLFLQAACREIEVGERRLILLLSDSGGQRAGVLLASPSAVGMYNLMPQAYLEELFSLRLPDADAQVLEILSSELLKKERKAAQVKALLLVQAQAKRPVKAETDFSGAAWVKPVNPAAGSLSACHDLVQALMGKKQANGLAVEVAADRQLFATWIERI